MEIFKIIVSLEQTPLPPTPFAIFSFLYVPPVKLKWNLIQQTDQWQFKLWRRVY